MKVLCINAGSSSLKFKMLEMPQEKVLISGNFERIGVPPSFYSYKINDEKVKKDAVLSTHDDAVKILMQELIDNNIINSFDEIDGIGHRVVHGGSKYSNSIIIDEDVINTIEDLSKLAPLHNPANLMGIRAFKEAVPNAVQIACFDTAFHQTIEEERFLYAVPYEWYTKYGIRKYGFHGMSHKYVSHRVSDLLDQKYINIIVCHLGQGASICAVRDGHSVDTSLGFTPNSGLMMGTRSGDIDYGVIPYLMRTTGMTLEEIDNKLNKESGMLGASGISNDFRDVEEKIDEGDERAIMAHYLFVNSIVGYIARFYVELGGIDAICFTAGVGENSPHVRNMIIKRLACLGLKLDREKNDEMRFGKEGLITKEDSTVPCYVIPTDEEIMMAKDTYSFLV